MFPAEGRCADPAIARAAIEDFREDTLAHGVIGGAAYMTVHTSGDAGRARAARPGVVTLVWSSWSGSARRICEPTRANLDDDVASLANDFGKRLIVTDRFAGAVDSPLRRRGVELSRRHSACECKRISTSSARKGVDREDSIPTRRATPTCIAATGFWNGHRFWPIAFRCGRRNSTCSPRQLPQALP